MCLVCCQVSGLGLSTAVAGENAAFRIAARDSRGNPVSRGGANFCVKVVHQGKALRSPTVSDGPATLAMGHYVVLASLNPNLSLRCL